MLDAAQSGTFKIGDEIAINRLGFGAVWVGDPELGPKRDDPKTLLKRVAELNVGLIDTANVYTQHNSERLIGESLSPYSPGTLVGTKVGLYIKLEEGGDRFYQNASPEFIFESVEDSLRRLKTDCIDLYQLHRVDPAVPLEESLHAIADLKAAGKVRFVGVSDLTIEQIDRARKVVPIATVQQLYGLLDRQGEDILNYCEREGIGFVPWGSLARGHALPKEASSVLNEIATAHDATPSQVSIAWSLQKSPVVLPIPGTSSVRHLEQNVAAASLSLSDAEMDRLDKLWSGKPMHNLAGSLIR